MTDSKIKTAKKNIASGLISRIISILAPFISRTILLRIMGSSHLGLNSLFNSILNVLNLAELGIDSAITYNMYIPIAEGDKAKVNSLLKLYQKLYRYIGFFILLTGLLCVPFLRFLVRGEIPDDIDLILVFLLYLSNTTISYLLFAYKKSLLVALQRNDIVSNISTIIIVLQNAMQILLYFLTKNYYLYSSLLLFFTILSNLLCNYVSVRLYPEYKPEGELDKQDKEEIKKQISGLMINKVCMKSRNAFDNIVISSLINLISVTIYSNYFYVINSVHGILGTILISITSIIGNDIITKSKDENLVYMKTIQFIYMWLSIWSMGCVFILYQDFMVKWAGSSLLLDNLAVILFSAYGFILCAGDVNGMYLDTNGLWWFTRKFTLIETIISLVLNILLAINIGLNGVILASLVSVVFSNMYYNPRILYKHYFGIEHLKGYLLELLKYIILFSFVCVISKRLCVFLSLHGLFLYIGKVVTVSLVTIIICICSAYRNKTAENAREMLSKLVTIKTKNR